MRTGSVDCRRLSADLKMLTHLHLKNNKCLDILPLELCTMPKLTFLSLEGCNLRRLPPAVVLSGSGGIIKYFRSLLRTKNALFKQCNFEVYDTQVTDELAEEEKQPHRKLSKSFPPSMRLVSYEW
ncbi:hypothetical protein EG68_09755 [Paragonimus skrjabini miyazakii]|uniref:Uncharacterized protein n=1 Tax=Paragonimus skrjabini miyazakii TaxID=59628 RepID=A0A8S9YDG9_9TREM|nr:hypothetical protein EG68_09755 [Paragonimus skrjabini miyazakii]